MIDRDYLHPEPVPTASQLGVLPFLAAVEGFFRNFTKDPKLRLTMHRTMVREQKGYLQQMCTYLGSGSPDQSRVGRMFPVTEGIIGAAYKKAKILRTKEYSTLDELHGDLRRDLVDTKDNRTIDQVAISWLAVPFLGRDNQVVLILFAESYELNFFANNARLQQLQAMCVGLCRLYDWLEKHSFPNLRNYPLERGEPAIAEPTVYPRLQEELRDPPAPRFENLTSFNYEASVT
jgi:hypothetical protein